MLSRKHNKPRDRSSPLISSNETFSSRFQTKRRLPQAESKKWALIFLRKKVSNNRTPSLVNQSTRFNSTRLRRTSARWRKKKSNLNRSSSKEAQWGSQGILIILHQSSLPCKNKKLWASRRQIPLSRIRWLDSAYMKAQTKWRKSSWLLQTKKMLFHAQRKVRLSKTSELQESAKN